MNRKEGYESEDFDSKKGLRKRHGIKFTPRTAETKRIYIT